MQISLGNNYTGHFRPWRPTFGRVFNSIYAFDTETTRIDEQHPWITPTYVLGAAFDGRQGYFVQREHTAAFLAAHAGVPMVMHNAAFDLEVLDLLVRQVLRSGLDIYEVVEQNQVWDTQLLHRLLVLGTEGHTAFGRGQSDLATCTRLYLGVELSKEPVDSDGNPVRLSYGKWLNRPPHEIEPVYLEYLAKDVIATFFVCYELGRRLTSLLGASSQAFGYVSPAWLAAQSGRWGVQTHHIQLKAAIVLGAISANGLHIDLESQQDVVRRLHEVGEELRQRLRHFGYMPGQKGSGKALQEILKSLERQHRQVTFPRTETGMYVTKHEALEELTGIEPFIRDLLDFRAVEKLQSFLTRMGRRKLHPSFNSLLVTGRTSSFGAINAQNLPRDDRVRSCFAASPGNVLIDADYAMVELATLAQAVLSQLQILSYMAGAINAGVDLHRLVASRVTGKPETEVTREERQKAKPINFGKPGGMGDEGLRRYAKSSYGVELNDQEVKAWSDSWFALFPEMRAFLSSDSELGKAIATFFNLTPYTFFEHTGSRNFLDHPNNQGSEHAPNSILGWMCRKVLTEPSPKTGRGRDYTAGEIDYFWTMVRQKVDTLPSEHRHAIMTGQPSIGLQRAVMRAVERAPCFTLTGRLRAKASYCARHNTLFQGLAADGAKLALWRLWRAGYRIVNFVHDEVLIEVPEDSNLRQHAERIRQLMIDAMREVVPNVRIDVEYAASRRWFKSAKAKFDDEGNLLVWEPQEDSREAPPIANLTVV